MLIIFFIYKKFISKITTALRRFKSELVLGWGPCTDPYTGLTQVESGSIVFTFLVDYGEIILDFCYEP